MTNTVRILGRRFDPSGFGGFLSEDIFSNNNIGRELNIFRTALQNQVGYELPADCKPRHLVQSCSVENGHGHRIHVEKRAADVLPDR